MIFMQNGGLGLPSYGNTCLWNCQVRLAGLLVLEPQLHFIESVDNAADVGDLAIPKTLQRKWRKISEQPCPVAVPLRVYWNCQISQQRFEPSLLGIEPS